MSYYQWKVTGEEDEADEGHPQLNQDHRAFILHE